jgi:cell division protein FtsB
MANFEEQNTVEPAERAELHKEVARLRAEVKLFKGDDYGQK